MAELVDALDLGSSSRKGVGVQVPSLAPIFTRLEPFAFAKLQLLLFKTGEKHGAKGSTFTI